MKSSDRRIVTARKLEDDPKKHDTLPAPPPSSADDVHSEEGHDTIPTPPPESGVTDVIVIPPHRRIDLENEHR